MLSRRVARRRLEAGEQRSYLLRALGAAEFLSIGCMCCCTAPDAAPSHAGALFRRLAGGIISHALRRGEWTGHGVRTRLHVNQHRSGGRILRLGRQNHIIILQRIHRKQQDVLRRFSKTRVKAKTTEHRREKGGEREEKTWGAEDDRQAGEEELGESPFRSVKGGRR